jgi:hypothetical protein
MVAPQLYFLYGSSWAIAYSVFGGLTDMLRYLEKQSYYISDLTLRDLLSWRFWVIMLYERYQSSKSLPLLEHLEMSAASGATDPRDRVFALLGLLDREENRRIKLDYSLSPCEVFCSAIRAMANSPERSETVMKVLAEWQPMLATATGHEGHQPLEENVAERLKCDGVACSLRKICLELPGKAKPDTPRVMQYFIAGLQYSKPRAWQREGGQNERSQSEERQSEDEWAWS